MRARLPPQTDDWPQRHIERTPGFSGEFLGCRKHGEQIGARFNGPGYCGAADPVQFAIRLIVRKLAIQLRDAAEGGAKPGIRLLR